MHPSSLPGHSHCGGPIGDAVRAGHLAVHGAVLDLAAQTISPLPITPNRPDVTETPR